MSKVKIKEIISISKEEILEKYCEMDDYYKNIIKALYGEKLDRYDLDFTINEYKAGFTIDDLNNEKGKVGCYIFIEDMVPVYIGVGGTEKRGLKDRIAQERRKFEKEGKGDKGATLSQNIQEIDGLSAEESVEKIKKFQLIAIIVGERDKRCDRYKAQALEAILIALFHPKYNK